MEEALAPVERRLPGHLLRFVLFRMVAASVVASLLAWVVVGLLDLEGIGVVAFVSGVLYGILLWTAAQVRSRAGGGSYADLFGWRFEWPADIANGLLVALLGTVLSTVAAVVFIESERFSGENTELMRHFRHDLPAYVVVVLLAVVAAPIVEELFFRGVLLPVLADRLGADRALFVQAALFGLMHVDPYAGTHNVSVVVGVGAIGWVLGWSAHHYRRLGPGIVAHAVRNGLTVVILFFDG